MQKEELKNINQLYVDLWHLVKNYHDAKIDKQWQELIEKAEQLVQQYGEFIRPLVIDTLELIEKGYKNSPK